MSPANQLRRRVRITLCTLGPIFLVSGLLFIFLQRRDVAGFALGAFLVLIGVISLVWGLGASFAHRSDQGDGVEGRKHTVASAGGSAAGDGR